MGKRGPAPQGEFEGQSAVLSTRIRPDTRAHLVKAAEDSHRSLSQEIEYRLSRSFVIDDSFRDAFGSRRNYYLMRMIAMTLENVINAKNIESNWRTDPETFEMAVKAVVGLLRKFKPDGEIHDPDDGLTTAEDEFNRREPNRSVESLWNAMEKADTSLPLSAGNRAQHLLRILKTELRSDRNGDNSNRRGKK